MATVGEAKFKEKLTAFINSPERDVNNLEKNEDCKIRLTREYLGLMKDLENKDKDFYEDSKEKPNTLTSPSQRRLQKDVAALLAERLHEILGKKYETFSATIETKSLPVASLVKLARLLELTLCLSDVDKASSARDDIVVVMAEENKVSLLRSPTSSETKFIVAHSYTRTYS